MAFHSHTFHCTLCLLMTQPDHNNLMPFMCIHNVMIFSSDQRHLTKWYTTWSDTSGYIMWHHLSADSVSIIPSFTVSVLYLSINLVMQMVMYANFVILYLFLWIL